MKKQLISALLVVAMICVITACGNKEESKQQPSKTEVSKIESSSKTEVVVEPKEEVTITYRMNNGYGELEDFPKVEKKLNEILDGIEGYEHINIDLIPSKSGELPTDLTLAIAAGEPIDLVANYGINFVEMVKDGDFLPLDDLLEQFPNVTSELPEWMIDFGKIDGVQYYIPSYQQATNLRFWGVPEEYLNMYLKKYSKTYEQVVADLSGDDLVKKMDFLEDLCLAVREGTGKDTKWINVASRTWQAYIRNVEYIGKNYGRQILWEGANGPTYWPVEEEYKIVQQRLNKWYHEGLIHPDYDTIQIANFIGANILNDESMINIDVENTCSVEYLETEIFTDVPMKMFRTSEHPYIAAKYAAGGNAIYTDCEHPEEAMMIIKLLMTKKGQEFYNTMVFGIEGMHWEWEDEANLRIKTLQYADSQLDANATYGLFKWNIGNTFNCYKNQAVQEGYMEYINEEIHNNPGTVPSPVMGITWDMSAVDNQLSECEAIFAEYDGSLMVIDPDKFEGRYNEFMNKLKAAGVQDVIDEMTKQYNVQIQFNK